MSIEEEKDVDGERRGESDPSKSNKNNRKKDKEVITRTLDEYIDVLNKYDDRKEHHVQLISNILTRRNEEVWSEDTGATSGAGTRTRRVGPRIISNVQIAPPRRQIDSASEMASESSLTETNIWKATRKKKNERIKRGIEGSPSPRTITEPRRPDEINRGTNERAAPRKSRLNKNAVVTLKAGNETMSYADILKTARQKINIKEIGIINPRIRKMANGGILMEIPGPEGHKRADILADNLRKEFGDSARIGRPIKFGELRIAGLDISVTPEELIGTLAESGQCNPENIKIGSFRENVRGMRTVWARCPLTAASALADIGKIEIGWSTARIELLKLRPVQCFKCWEFGHVRNACKANVERQGCCFGCGSNTHSVRDCRGPFKCVICEDRGLASKHRIGTASCSSLASSMKNRQGSNVGGIKLINNGR